MNAFIEKKVHELYWDCDVNCARTMLICLGELFGVTYEPQTLNAAVGLHGAGGYRAQCGLVEGSLMFAGVYLNGLGWGRRSGLFPPVTGLRKHFPASSDP